MAHLALDFVQFPQIVPKPNNKLRQFHLTVEGNLKPLRNCRSITDFISSTIGPKVVAETFVHLDEDSGIYSGLAVCCHHELLQELFIYICFRSIKLSSTEVVGNPSIKPLSNNQKI